VAQEGNGIWLGRDVDGLRSSILLDPETGHYTARGIKRRLDELVALSQRNDEALSCVLFGADPVPDGIGVATEALRDAAFEFATVLHQRTRRTDVVGWIEPLKFVVLAPRTPPFGGLRLAERFISMSLSRYVAGEFAITFGAGVAGVEGRTEGLEACPDTLVAAAQQALLDARTAGAAQVAAAWPGV
jgi:GGDEF domain-containing protein